MAGRAGAESSIEQCLSAAQCSTMQVSAQICKYIYMYIHVYVLVSPKCAHACVREKRERERERENILYT